MLRLEIVTPEKKVLDEPVDSVTVPTANGEVGILPQHAPLISALKPGILAYTRGGAVERMVSSGGFLEVSGVRVSVLAGVAGPGAEIDVDAARSERESAEKVLGAWSGSEAGCEVERERRERGQ